MDERPDRLTTPTLLGILLGLAVVGGAVYQLLRKPSEDLGAAQGRTALEERFEVTDPIPFDLTVQAARRLPEDELYVTLAPDGEQEEPEPLPFDGRIAKKKKGGSRGGGGRGRGGGGWGGDKEGTEWGKVKLGDEGASPIEAAFLFVDGKEKGDALLGRTFGVRFRDLNHLGSDGAAVPIDSGHEAWGPYDANWIHMRHFQLVDGVPTSHDTVRVNLTTTREARVVYLRWPRTRPADPEQVWEFLASFQPSEG